MKKALLIAEKPSLMKKIRTSVQKYGFPDNIAYKTFAGHTMSLKMPAEYTEDWERMKTTFNELPMIPQPFEYKVSDDKKNIYNELVRELKNGDFDYVINACDAGREGQHIFWSFYENSGSNLPVKRLWAKSQSVEGLGKALKSLRDDDNDSKLVNMKEASKLRAQFDWLVGMNESRAFSMKARQGIAVGRVMTPTLAIVVERELEIKNFVPEDFWEVEVEFDGYKGKYFNKETKGRFTDKDEADKFIKGLSDKGTITNVTKKEVVTNPPKLFSLQSLTSEMGKKFNFTSKEVLATAQSLYDDGFITYPRTDTEYVTKDTAKEFPKYLNTLTSFSKLQKKATKAYGDKKKIQEVINDTKYVNDKKVEDHDAITPTEQVPNRPLTSQEKFLYDTIARRFLALFMDPLIVEKTRIVTEVDGHEFRTNGSILKQDGFTLLYGYAPNDTVLPQVSKGEEKKVFDIELLTRQTTPPKRYTDTGLGDIMEDVSRRVDDKQKKDALKESKGIGTQATRASIIEKLKDKGWIETKGKAKTLYATDAGISLIKALKGHDLTSPEMTAEWETQLKEVEKGSKKHTELEKQMHDYIIKAVNDIENMTISGVVSSKKSKNGVGKVLGTCPHCGKNVIVGKKFYFCEEFKPKNQGNCDFIMGKKIAGASINQTEMKKLLDGKETKVLNFKKGEKEYQAKLSYDKSKKNLDFEFAQNHGKTTKQKTKDGKQITEDKFYWRIPNTEDKISKDYWGTKISITQAKKLFDGEKVGPFNFTSKKNQPYTAYFIYNKNTKKLEKTDYSN